VRIVDQDIVTASVVEYRVIRPDGTVLWQLAAASYMDFTGPPLSLDPGMDRLPLGRAGDWIGPPWQIQRREFGPEWVTIAER